MVDDDRVIWQAIGEPPESPWGYATRNGISEEEVPHQVFQAWRRWNDAEQALVEKAAEKGFTLEDLGYQNEADKGKSMFARYTVGEKAGVLDQIQKDAFEKAVNAGHFTYDPESGQYYNVGHGDPNDKSTWQWVEGATGGLAQAGRRNATRNSPLGSIKNVFNSGYNSFNNQNFNAKYSPLNQNNLMKSMGFAPDNYSSLPTSMKPQAQQQPTGPKRGDAGYRPMLKTDPNNFNYGAWGSAYNRPMQTGSAVKRTNTFGYQPASGMGGY